VKMTLIRALTVVGLLGLTASAHASPIAALLLYILHGGS
jgi:hypothetical protein